MNSRVDMFLCKLKLRLGLFVRFWFFTRISLSNAAFASFTNILQYRTSILFSYQRKYRSQMKFLHDKLVYFERYLDLALRNIYMGKK